MTAPSTPADIPAGAPRTRHLGPDLPITFTDTGAGDTGRTALVLHGGGGPGTVQGLARHLARTLRVLTPTHPGWGGTPRSPRVTTVAELATAYLDLLAAEGVRDALVVGSSIGGWIALEAALRDRAGRVGGLVLVDAVGVAVEGEPIRDFAALDARSAAAYSFHDADRFYVDPATVTEERAAARRADMAAMHLLAGDPYMHDPGLLGRLGDIRVPTTVLWGASDRIVTPAYGRRLAAAIPGADFQVLPEAGHLPQIERPEAVFAALDAHTAAPGAAAG